jgi:tetratricopeptide (TPR) repeat protein
VKRAAFVASFALLAISAAPAVAQQRLSGPTLVMPFTAAADARSAWLGEAVAMLLTDDIDAMGAGVLTRDERIRALERLQVPPRAGLTSATAIKIGQLVGASTVVTGSAVLNGDVLTVGVQSIRIDTGRVAATFDEHGPLTDMLAILERSARRLVPYSNVPTDVVEKQHPPLPAYESYVKGLLAETPATAITYLQNAIALAPTFDRARLALASTQSEVGNFEAARTAALAIRESSPSRRDGQFAAALAEINLKRFDDAFARLQQLNATAPTPELLTNLGVIQLRRTPTAQQGRATYFLHKAVELNTMSADAMFNLGYAYWEEQDGQASVYWLKEAVRLDPADADAHFVLASALDATGAGTEGGRERELARRLSAGYEEGESGRNATAVPRGLERMALFLQRPEAGRADSALVATEQREQREMATFHLDRGRRFYDREEDRAALTELRRAIYLSPYQAEAHLLVGRLHLRAGRTRDAIEALKISLWSEETAEAHEALGEAYLLEKNTAAAHAEAERALALRPGYAEATQLLKQAAPIQARP